MAIKTYYLMEALSDGWYTAQESVPTTRTFSIPTAPAGLWNPSGYNNNTSYIMRVGTTVTQGSGAADMGTADVAAAVQPASVLTSPAINAFRIGPISGIFAPGTWNISLLTKNVNTGNTLGAGSVSWNMNLFKGINPTDANAKGKINASTIMMLQGSQYTSNLSTSNVLVSGSFTLSSPLTFDNEYLYVAVAVQAKVNIGSANRGLTFVEGSTTSIQTTDLASLAYEYVGMIGG